MTDKSILVFDPGESTGWVFMDREGKVVGGTCPKDHMTVAERFHVLHPDIVVLERFNLYPGMAKSLSWNSFYPCEVIGVIKYLCKKMDIPWYEQAPSVKKYSGLVSKNTSKEWAQLRTVCPNATEHTWDALQHLHYFLRNLPKALRHL